MTNKDATDILMGIAYSGPVMIMLLLAFIVPYSKYLKTKCKLKTARKFIKTVETHTLIGTRFNDMSKETLKEIDSQ